LVAQVNANAVGTDERGDEQHRKQAYDREDHTDGLDVLSAVQTRAEGQEHHGCDEYSASEQSDQHAPAV
jgi:hypothetical protein